MSDQRMTVVLKFNTSPGVYFSLSNIKDRIAMNSLQISQLMGGGGDIEIGKITAELIEDQPEET